MRKTLTFLLFLTQLNLSFAQEKIPLVFPNDSIFEVNDSINKLPFFQITPIIWTSINFGYLGSNKGFPLDISNLNIKFNVSRFSLDFVYKETFGEDYFHPLGRHEWYKPYNYISSSFGLDFRFLTLNSSCKTKVRFKSLEKVNKRKIKSKKVVLTNTFHNFNFGLAYNYNYYNNPQILSNVFIEDNTLSSDNYQLIIYNGSNQNFLNFKFSYNRLKKVKLSNSDFKGSKFSNLTLFATLITVLKDKPIFYSAVNSPGEKGGPYSIFFPNYLKIESYFGETSKYLTINKFGVKFGANYEHSLIVKYLAFNLGFEIGYLPKYTANYFETKNPNEPSFENYYTLNDQIVPFNNFFVNIKAGLTLNIGSN